MNVLIIQTKMKYEYLQYWIESMEDIKLLEQLMEENLYMYQRIQDTLYLEYIINNIEIIELKQLIWQKIFEEEEEELMNQEWYEISEIDRVEIEMLKFNLSDLEIQYSD